MVQLVFIGPKGAGRIALHYKGREAKHSSLDREPVTRHPHPAKKRGQNIPKPAKRRRIVEEPPRKQQG